MRLIDANDALERLKKAEQQMKVVSILGYKAVGMDGVIEFIETRPTVDAVEVVRCKDCKHYDERFRTDGEITGKVYCGGYCYHWDHEQGMSPNQVDGDDFCSYGERKDDGKNQD